VFCGEREAESAEMDVGDAREASLGKGDELPGRGICSGGISYAAANEALHVEEAGFRKRERSKSYGAACESLRGGDKCALTRSVLLGCRNPGVGGKQQVGIVQ